MLLPALDGALDVERGPPHLLIRGLHRESEPLDQPAPEVGMETRDELRRDVGRSAHDEVVERRVLEEAEGDVGCVA